jgi:uncharacterized protein (TIGR02996 family)
MSLADIQLQLTQSTEQLHNHDAETALAGLVALWQQHRSAFLAGLIADLGSAVAESLPEIKLEKAPLFHEHWFKIAQEKQAVNLDILLSHWTHGAGRHIKDRVEFWLSQPADPRLTLPMVSFVNQAKFSSTTLRPVWTKVFQLLEHLNDPRSISGLTAKLLALQTKKEKDNPSWWDGGFEDYLSGKIQTSLKNIGELDTDLDERLFSKFHDELNNYRSVPKEKRKAWVQDKQKEQTKAKSSPELGSQLLQAIYDQPDNDEARLVLGDWLQEQEQPLGRFIMLQYQRRQRKLTSKEQREEKQLIKKHCINWLQPIYRLLDEKSLYFSRGFLAACTVMAQARQHLEHPLWNTLSELNGPANLLCHLRHTIVTWGRSTPSEISSVPYYPLYRNGIVDGSLPIEDWLQLTQQKEVFAVQTAFVEDNSIHDIHHFKQLLRPDLFPHLSALVWQCSSDSAITHQDTNPPSYEQWFSWLLQNEFIKQIKHFGIEGATYGLRAQDTFCIPKAWKYQTSLRISLGSTWYAHHQRSQEGLWSLVIFRIDKQTFYQLLTIKEYFPAIQVSDYTQVRVQSEGVPFSASELEHLRATAAPFSKIEVQDTTAPSLFSTK